MALPARYVLPLFFLVVFVGATILGPALYFGMAYIWPIPFHRAMDRALLISALGALALFWSRIPWKTLWPRDGDAWKQLLIGLLIAAVSIQAILGLYLATAGFTGSHLSAAQIWGRVLLAFVAAIVAAPVEETVFRGFLQRETGQWLGWRAGVILSALIFALAHFLKIPESLDHQPVNIGSGLAGLGAAFSDLGSDLLLPANFAKALNLFLVGVILGGTFLRAGSLWFNAGLHGGWIFGMLLFTGLTRPLEPPRIAFFGGDILSTPATTLVLVATGLWLWRYYRHPSIVPDPSPGIGSNAG